MDFPVRGALSIGPRCLRGIATAVRARSSIFTSVAAAVFVLHLLLPVTVLSLARKPADHFTFNPWLSRLPEYLASDEDPPGRKLEFLSKMALAWVSADNPVEGLEWGFVVDVPSLGRFVLTALLFGAYFALWVHRRDQVRRGGWVTAAGPRGGLVGALISVLGFSTGPCSVVGCGVPVLPVVGLALTGVSSSMLAFFAGLARVAVIVILAALAGAVAWLGWVVGRALDSRPLPPR